MADFKARDYILKGKQIIEQKPNFSTVETAVSKGKLYKDVDNDGDTYYYRGAVEDNYFKFGDKFYRIIRINGNGSIRLIYDGSKAYANGDTSGASDRAVGSNAYNNKNDDNKYVGFRYEQDVVHGYAEPSTILGADENPAENTLNKWYEDNILNTYLEKYIDKNAGFICDRTNSTSSSTLYENMNDNGGTGAKNTWYGAYARLVNAKSPIFTFKNNGDYFTAKNTEKGNKSLIYPVGLITADEVAFAGGVVNQKNGSYYLCNNNSCQILSPYYFVENYARSLHISASGILDITHYIDIKYHFRPVINILGSVNLTGDGTMESPYEITEPVIHHKLAKNGEIIQSIYKNGEKWLGIAHAGELIWKFEEIKYDIKPFAEASDEEIASYLDLHYKDKIKISDYWKVGDTRVVHIDATNSGTVNHVAQNMTMVIMDFNHDDLTTPINDKAKAAVTVGFREVMGNMGSNEQEFYWGMSHYPVPDTNNYSVTPLRTWLNSGLLSALPSTFISIIKEVNKKNLRYHSKKDEAPLITKDKIWLLSYPEVFGTETYDEYLSGANPSNYEGEQYEYMKISANRIKKLNNNGVASSNDTYYWLRSPSSYYSSSNGYYWCDVQTSGTISISTGSLANNLAPAFCL